MAHETTGGNNIGGDAPGDMPNYECSAFVI